ncbi:hypothetical protein ESA94_02480 [Lacibacter luteus]|uniref:Uncharacterized protein n=1 Tax=Lacibacter luteus TaxID=2508719 RepID=A0A4V1M7X8_9BACT|nr:hypothetical protein [Lacibacter luteus]RXK61902.1 hypothetical protein ESA94_02480 [Lacibacter luteus]
MKQHFLLILLLALQTTLIAQNSTVNWGEDLKIKRGTTELTIITADNTGVYVQEGGVRYFTIGINNMTGFKFRKFDKFYNEVYEEDYKQELKGKELNRIIPFKNKLYIFADDYDKKEKQFITYAAEIDKASGKLKTDWKEIVVVPRENRGDAYEFTIIPSSDSSSMILVADISNNDRSSVKVLVMNEALQQQSVTTINLQYAKNSYALQDVLFTNDKKILLVGKIYEEVELTKKRKRLMFKKLSIEKYDLAGKKEMELPTSDAGKVLVSAKMIQNKKGELFVCGFYSNNAKTQDINGLLVNRIDLATGTVIASTTKQIDPSMIGTFDDDADDDKDAETKQSKLSSKQAAAEGDLDGFSSDFLFRKIFVGQDNSILLLAEKFRFDTYTRTESSYDGQRWTYRTVTTYQYTSGDLLTIKVGDDGTLKWVNVIPKLQVEAVKARGPATATGVNYNPHLFISGGLPFYSSFNVAPFKNKLIFYYNDNTKNAAVKKVGDKAKSTYNFSKSNCYTLTLDLTSGDVARKFLFTNEDEPIAMVRHGMLTGNELYLVAYKPSLLGKSTLKLGKITIR